VAFVGTGEKDPEHLENLVYKYLSWITLPYRGWATEP
jgi:hypothetical protein